MTYGKTTTTHYTDPEVTEINVHTTRLGKVVPAGQHVVDNYPVLKYVPFVVSTLRKWHEEELELFSRMVDGVRAQVVRSISTLHTSTANLRCPERESRTTIVHDVFAGTSARIRTYGR